MTTDTTWLLRHRPDLVRWLEETTSMDSHECFHVAGGILNRLNKFYTFTPEREKVAALEAENAKFRTMLGGSTALAEGLGIRTDAIMQEVALAAYKQLEEAKAQATRWREVAGELAGAAKDMDGWEECLDPDACNLWAAERDFEALRAALARFNQESGQ